MAHCSIVGCNNNQANNGEVTYFNLPKNSQGQKNWLAAVNRDEGNVPSNVSVYFNHFEDKFFDKTSFFSERPIKKFISTAIQMLLPLNKYQHLGKLLRLKQSRKKKKM